MGDARGLYSYVAQFDPTLSPALSRQTASAAPIVGKSAICSLADQCNVNVLGAGRGRAAGALRGPYVDIQGKIEGQRRSTPR